MSAGMMNELIEGYLKDLFGPHVIYTVGKFITSPPRGIGNVSMFAGTVVSELPGTDKNHQMWECEVVIIPRRKFKDKGVYNGYRIDQILVRNFGDRDTWAEAYWIEAAKR